MLLQEFPFMISYFNPEHMPSRYATFAAGIILYCTSALFIGCSDTPEAGRADATAQNSAPTLIRGSFEDDYDITYSITDSSWQQHPAPPMSVVEWDTAAQYVIVRNAKTDSLPSQQFTRIDWLALDGFPPYTWAYCYTIYDAETVAQARNADPAVRDTPRNGCNGFPFSRMQPAN